MPVHEGVMFFTQLTFIEKSPEKFRGAGSFMVNPSNILVIYNFFICKEIKVFFITYEVDFQKLLTKKNVYKYGEGGGW